MRLFSKIFRVGLATEPLLPGVDDVVHLLHEIDGQARRPLRLRRLPGGTPFDASMTIREGRRRQVRRMFEAVGVRVTALRRVREGPLSLGDLPEGAVRTLSASEVELLRGESETA